MSFFGPISTPVLDESSTPLIRRALHRARVVGNFALVQAIVQIIGFMSGILIVRTLEQREYAYFTIANTMQGTINLRADIGRIQVIDITAAVGRLLPLAGLLFVFLNAGIAVAVASAVSLLQYAMLRNYAAGVIDLDAPENPEDRHSMVRLIKHLAANSVF